MLGTNSQSQKTENAQNDRKSENFNFLVKIWLKLLELVLYQLMDQIKLAAGPLHQKILIDMKKTCQKLQNSIFGQN